MQVASVQLAVRDVRDADRALEESLVAIAAAAALGARLVVLPECTWPGYMLGSSWPQVSRTLAPTTAVMARYAGLAAEAGIVLVVGLAVDHGRVDDLDRHAGGTTRNVAVVWDADGTLRGMAHKRFLWDFDRRWFTAGDDSPVFDTAAGRIGVLVCADGRLPEIARLLAVRGAEIVLDPTAWVTAGGDPRTWSNPQFEHMLRTRARENGVWTVAANKVGIERDAIAYCGRSCIIDPHGRVVAEAPTDRPAITTWDCEPRAPVFPVARRPELYRRLTAPTEDLPVARTTTQALVPAAHTPRVAVDLLAREHNAGDAETLRDLDVAMVVSHRPAGALNVAGLLLTRSGSDTAVLDRPEGPVQWQRTHGPGATGTTIGPVVDSAFGGLGVMFDEDGLAPEVCRSLMLDGADLVVWFVERLEVAGVAATRAAENRIHLIVCAPAGAPTSARILAPTGAVLADAGDAARVITAVLPTCDPRTKQMAPGTDVVAGRRPGEYRELTQAVADRADRAAEALT